MKRCTNCNELKALSEFSKYKKSPDYLQYNCKKCLSIKSKLYIKTKDGLVTKIYVAQKQSSKRRNHPMPNYTLKELRKWMFSQSNFETLYNNWVNSGYIKDLTPSCDRNDDYAPYTFKNLTITTWYENNRKYNLDKINGVNNKQNKAVIQLSLKNVFIDEYYSIAQAERITGISQSHISKCCQYKYKTAGKFKWKYKN